MVTLPNYLYRGDSDQFGIRKLKANFKSELILTNLCSGGNGREIFNVSLGQLIGRHVGTGWDTSHFLSFSSEKKTAYYYGSAGKEYEEVYDESELWDFTVMTLDTTVLIQSSINKIGEGIYSAHFIPTNNIFLPTYHIILIDAFSHLQSISSRIKSDMTAAISNANKDKEWLVLPAAPFGHQGEFSGRLDAKCISAKELFRYI